VAPNTAVSQRGLKPVTLREEKTINPIRTDDVLSGRYRLIEKIGEGGMGTVYTAHDQELDRQVAVKLLAANLVNEPDIVERFEREAKLTAKLDHPNIVPIYDVGRHENRPFLVMKLLNGDTLAGVLRQKGGLTSDETIKVLKQVAAGLDYIHGQGFIHRDVKAGNIWVAPNGHVTILDFGILRSRTATQGLTRTGMVMGTPHYMAPEQAMGLKDVDHRVDIYALAVVLFECLTGTLPFEADSELRLIQMQAHAPPPDIIDRAPWITRPVADVVRKALAKRPEDRFNTGAELVKALETAYRESKGHLAAPRAPATPVVSTFTAPSLRKLEQSPPPSEEVPIIPASQASLLSDTDDLARSMGGPRWGLIAGIVLVAVALGGLAWRQLSVEDTHLPLVEPRAATAPDAATLLASQAQDAGAAEAADAAVELALGEADGGEDEEDAGAPAALVLEDPHRLPVVKAKRAGLVNILSFHGDEAYWAQVSIDGVPRGRTPLRLELPTGAHRVLVERPGFKVESRDIRIASDHVVKLRIDLTP
jgi:serine/threonine-protein kinase